MGELNLPMVSWNGQPMKFIIMSTKQEVNERSVLGVI